MEAALRTLIALHPEAGDNVNRSDWAEMAKVLGDDGYTTEDVAKLFYPQGSEHADRRLTRRKDFLSGFEDETYQQIYRRLCQGEKLCFPDIDKIFGTKKDEGQIMRRMMMHVVRWVNPAPHKATNIRSSNKPLHRKSLIPALRRRYESRPDLDEATKDARAESDALQLEKTILDFVRGNMSFFKSTASLSRLEKYPESSEEREYAERFVEKPWREVLLLARASIGAELKPAWIEGGRETARTSSLARLIVTLAREIPEVSGDEKLSSYEAMEELCAAIDGPVRQWAARRRNGTGRDAEAATAREGSSQVSKCDGTMDHGNEEDDMGGTDAGNGTDSSPASSPTSRVLLTPSPAKTQNTPWTRTFQDTAEEGMSLPGSTKIAPGNGNVNGNSSRQRSKTREEPSSSGGRRERVGAGARGRTPMSPVHRQADDGLSRADKQGSPIRPAVMANSQRPRQLRKAKDSLPSISEVLAGFHSNDAYGNLSQSRRRPATGSHGQRRINGRA